jgi:hypothetical protein
MPGRLTSWIEARGASFAARRDPHVIAALIMVAIAALAAVASSRMALAEQRAANLERRLASGQVLDLSYQQQLSANRVMLSSLVQLQGTLFQESKELSAASASSSSKDAGASAWLELHAAALTAEWNALESFRLSLIGPGDLSELSAAYLRSQGFDAKAEGHAGDRVVEFPQLQTTLEQAHERVPKLAVCIVLYVCGLVCLTVAELGLGSRGRWWILVGVGCLFGLCATAGVLAVDGAASGWIALAALLLGIWLWLAERRGLFPKSLAAEHPPDPGAPQPAEIGLGEILQHGGHDRWSRRIVLLIATSVVMTSVFVLLYSECLKRSGSYSLEAQRQQVELANQRTALSTGTLQSGYMPFLATLQARIRCASASQFLTLAQDGLIALPITAMQSLQQQRCDTELGWRMKIDPVLAFMEKNRLYDGGQQPLQRLRERIFDRADGPSEREALADGLAEVSAGWLHRSAWLLAVLTILAMALYLFGQAYRMNDTTPGRALVNFGVLLLGTSLLIGGFAWWAEPVMISDATVSTVCNAPHLDSEGLIAYAAHHYADGVAQYHAALSVAPRSRERHEAYAAAAAALRCATLARPSFIEAYKLYAAVLAQMNSSSVEAADEGILPGRESIAELREVEHRQLQTLAAAGVPPSASVLASFAYASTLLALTDKHQSGALADALMAFDVVFPEQAPWWRKLSIRWQRPELWSEHVWPAGPNAPENMDASLADARLNFGLAQLATGDPERLTAAERSYDQAVQSSRSPFVLGAGLTDLEILRAYCRTLHAEGNACDRIEEASKRIRARLALAARATDIPANSAAAVSDVNPGLTPYSATWQMRVKHFDPTKDRLAVVWFRDQRAQQGAAPNGSEWQIREAVPELTDRYGPRPPLPVADADGFIRNTRVSENACLGAGRYVADVFVNGRLVEAEEKPIELKHDMRLSRSKELGLQWCIPREWSYSGSDPAQFDSDPTQFPWIADKPMRSYKATYSARPFRAAIMSFYAPRSMSEEQRRSYFLRRGLRMLLSDSIPAAADQTRLVENAVLFQGPGEQDCPATPLNGNVIYRVIDSIDGQTVHLALISGDIPVGLACSVLASVRLYQ